MEEPPPPGAPPCPACTRRAGGIGARGERPYNERVSTSIRPAVPAVPHTRRAFLRLLAASGGAWLVACGGASGRPAPGEVRIGAPGGATPATPVPVTVSPEIEVTAGPARIGIGEAASIEVRAQGVASAMIEFLGVRAPLWPAGERLVGMIGVPLEQSPAAAAPVTVLGLDALGVEVARADVTCAIVNVQRPVDYLVLTPDQSSVLTPDASAREAEIRGTQFVRFDRARRWQRSLLVPTEGPLTTFFGQGRSYNNGPVGSFHTGTDIGAPEGAAVVVAAPGRVDWVGDMPIRGTSVLVDHGDGIKTGYHHLSRARVAVGEVVRTGFTIGEVGATGLATGPHLHWELTVWGVNVDPMPWTERAPGV